MESSCNQASWLTMINHTEWTSYVRVSCYWKSLNLSEQRHIQTSPLDTILKRSNICPPSFVILGLGSPSSRRGRRFGGFLDVFRNLRCTPSIFIRHELGVQFAQLLPSLATTPLENRKAVVATQSWYRRGRQGKDSKKQKGNNGLGHHDGICYRTDVYYLVYFSS